MYFSVEEELLKFKRSKRWFGWKNIASGLGKFFKFVGQAVVATVKVVDETPIKMVEAGVKVFEGDSKSALDKVREIKILTSANSANENLLKLGENLVNGTWNELGNTLLDLAVDCIGMIPLPIGRALGLAAKVVKKIDIEFEELHKKTVKASRNTVKPDRQKQKPTVCKNNKTKRASDSRKRPRNLCDADDEDYCHQKVVMNIDTIKSDCRKEKKAGSQCNLVCGNGELRFMCYLST